MSHAGEPPRRAVSGDHGLSLRFGIMLPSADRRAGSPWAGGKTSKQDRLDRRVELGEMKMKKALVLMLVGLTVAGCTQTERGAGIGAASGAITVALPRATSGCRRRRSNRWRCRRGDWKCFRATRPVLLPRPLRQPLHRCLPARLLSPAQSGQGGEQHSPPFFVTAEKGVCLFVLLRLSCIAGGGAPDRSR